MRNFGRHIKEGFIGFFRHPANSVATVFTMFISLLLVSFFLIVVLNLTNLTKEVEGSLSLSALVDYDVSSEKIDTIKREINVINGVASVEFRSSDEEFNYYIEQNQDLKDFYETYRDDNPFHSTFLVNVEDGSMMNSIKNTISSIDGIFSVHDGGKNTYKLIDILHNVRLSGLIIVGALAFLAIYLIYNTIKLSIDNRANEIGIMRIVGATNGFIRAPFLIEGMIIGVIGAFFTMLISVIVYLYIYSTSDGVLLGVFSLLDPFPFIIYISACVFGIGILSGLVGSLFSVNKSLRKYR